MPHIRPFRAVRYAPERAGRLEELLAPPYDVIDASLQDRLYGRSPRNIVRLELGRSFAGDTATSNRYTRAAALYRRWRESGILVLDDEPAVYLYAQSYPWGEGNRLTWGWVAAARLEPPGGVYLPHEATLPGPKADRLALWEATRAVFSQVFGLYHATDTDEAILARQVMDGPPWERYVDDQQVEHRVWRVPAGPAVERLAAALKPQRVVLADGHHRFETAVALAQGPLGSLPGAGWAALWLVNTALSPVTVLPTHRVLVPGPGVPDRTELVRRARERFEIIPLDEPAGPVREGAGFSPTGDGKETALIQMVTSDGAAWLLVPRGRQAGQLAPVVLHRELLDPILEAAGRDQAEGAEQLLRFTHDEAEARRWVASGQGEAAFILPALDGEAVRQAAEVMGRLPQKSTYFYPKAPSGLLIYDLEESLG